MRAFELYDYVFLKDNPTLVGTIERTNTESYEPLEDTLIIAHTDVPVDIINQFVLDGNGVPPPGYVFVEFENESSGSALVSEGDLGLLSRTFQIGDNVKTDDALMTGTVVNLSVSYVLAPILSCSALSKSHNLPTCGPGCPPTLDRISHPNPHALICDVPSQEVKRAQDLIKDDYLIAEDWIGQVEDIQYDIVVCLENSSIVVVRSSEGLYLPVQDNGKPLITLPEDDNWRPDVVVALQGWSHTIQLLAPRVGQFVIADRAVLRTGRWLKGNYDPKYPAQGTILDVRAGEALVNWERRHPPSDVPVKHNPSAPASYDYETEIYASKNWSDSASICLRSDLSIYDSGKMPPKTENGQTLDPQVVSQNVCTGHDIKIGNQVRFRNPADVTKKYQGNGQNDSHGSLVTFDAELSHGWDLNEFKVLHIEQEVTVLWQDGSISIVDSLSLKVYSLFEPELAPTDIVLKREGMRQRAVGAQKHSQAEVKDFDEMTFFEKPHDLIPRSVGVIQNVDPIERVVCVRWFTAPKIELRSNGQSMSPLSRYGPIGDEIEDLSLYEIMSFPALQRKRRYMCLVRPPASNISDSKELIRPPGPSIPRSFPSIGSSNERKMAKRSPPSRAIPQISHSQPPDSHQSRPPIDWFGEIVALELDGSSTVRLGGLEPCRDIQVSSDRLEVLEDEDFMDDSDDDEMDVDSWGEYSEWSDIDYLPPNFSISESVEYEGGHRLDNDSGDENWESEDEEETRMTDANKVNDHAADVDMIDTTKENIEEMAAPVEKSVQQLAYLMPAQRPFPFAILQSDPPSDQFGLHSMSPASISLKRISKEHQILASSLPEGEIFVRTYESRLDLLRCLIIGPRDTPYENAPFLIDLLLPGKFPDEPPTAHFHSWTSGLGRVNPNLYEEGKICLSLLGTWSGKHESEKWSDKATILQLLVSLQGLVFVKRPFFNEAGFEGYENDQAYTRGADLYSEKAFLMSRGFVKHALTRPPAGMEDVLAWTYLSDSETSPISLLRTVIQRGKMVIDSSEEARLGNDTRLMDTSGRKDDETQIFLKPLSRGAGVMLNRIMNELETLLAQLGQKHNEHAMELIT